MSGASINDRYAIKAELGRGGMGIVYRAFDEVLAREVAIKLLSEASLGAEGRERLLHEARAAAGLNHPNIVAIFDAGETRLADSTERIPFIVMELVDGQSLYQEMPLDPEQIVPMVTQVCQALHHAHSHNIVHRDLKPENILLLPDGSVKLMDFGLARSVVSRLTGQGQIMGTVYYLAPELALGQRFDGRADLYALGVLLYELTTGRLPFEADDPLAVVSQHIHAPVVPPGAHNNALSPALDRLILRLLEKDPANRPADSMEVAESLAGVGGEPILDLREASRGEFSVLDRIVRGRFIGRRSDLADAKTWWQKSSEGTGQVLLISGEPGIGKTRFVRELRTFAEVTGGKALAGVCYSEGGAPYAPFAQIITTELQHDGRSIPEHVLADLLTLAPSLGPKYAGIPPNPALDPQAEQYRLYENMFVFAAQQSVERPLMMVFEDVHWADSGTLAMIRHLARRAKGHRILLVATYREVEIDQARPLNRFLLDMNRERLAHRIKLTRLDKEETASLLEAILAEEITPEFLEAIYRETEGNPFFIEEVCKALIDSGKLYFENGRWQRPEIAELEIPQSIRISIQSRLGFLSPEVHQALLPASAMGRSFDFETLKLTSDLPEQVLIDALEEAERAQLIQEIGPEGGGTFAFSHALIPTTMLEGASGLRRRQLHRRLLEVLAERNPDDQATLAHHAFRSGDQRRGMNYAIQAGEQALRLYAAEEAVQYFVHALEAAETLDLKDRLRIIHQKLGDVFALQGNLPEAIDQYEAAYALSDHGADQAVLKAKIGEVHTVAGDARSQEILLEALDILDPNRQPGQRAVTLANLGRTYHLQGKHRQAISRLDEALELARSLDDPGSLTTIYGYLSGAYQHLAEIKTSLEYAEQLTHLGDRLHYPYATALGYEFLAEGYLIWADWQKGLHYGRLNRELGKKLGALDRVAWADFSISIALHGLGELSAARDAALGSLEIADELGHPRLSIIVGAQLAKIYLDLGEVDPAEAAAAAAYKQSQELQLPFPLNNALDAVGSVQLVKGQFSEALQSYLLAAEIFKDSDSPLNPWTAFVGLSEAYLGLGELTNARQSITQFVEAATERSLNAYRASGMRVLGQILAAEDSLEAAAEMYAEAAAIFTELNSRLDLAKVLYHHGVLRLKAGENYQAQSLLAQAHDLATACGAQRLLKRIGQENLDEAG